jgi:hypothetical protein
MSFDIFVQDIPAAAKSVAEIPEDFVPKPIGARSAVIASICKVAPEVKFSSPEWGTIDGDGYSIDVNLGLDDPVTSFAFHLYGEKEGLFIVAGILDELGARAFAPGTESGLFELDRATEAYLWWQEYRDQLGKR